MCPPPERERRLRSHLRHERMALAESTHHSAQRQKTARAGEEARDALHGHVPEAPLLWGVGQHLCLRFLAGSHGFLRHVVWTSFRAYTRCSCGTSSNSFVHTHMILSRSSKCPRSCLSMSLYAPPCAFRSWQNSWWKCTTIVSCSSIHRTVDQHVDIPVPGGGGSSSGLQGFSPGQSSTVTPSSKKRISERIVEQIVGPVSSGGLYGSLSGQGSSSLQYALVWSMSLVCSRAGSSSAAAVLLRGRLHTCRCAEFIPWSRQFVRPGIHQLLHMVVDVPVSTSSRFTFPSWRRGRFMVQTVRLTMDIPQLLNTVADVPVVRSCSSRVQTWRIQLSSHSCISLNSGLVVACPLCATTGAEWFGVQKLRWSRSCSALTW